MKAYDPIPNFNCNDPYPAPIPRMRISRLALILGAGCWIAAAALIAVLVAVQFP